MLRKIWQIVMPEPAAEPGIASVALNGPVEPWMGGYNPTTTTGDIYACFRLLLGRLPNREEWVGHSSRTGEPLPGVVGSYLNSLEFSRRGLLQYDFMEDVALAELPDFKIYAAAGDAAVGRHVRSNDYEPDVSAVFRRFVCSGMGVIDIGANIGYFTMMSASLTGPDGYVLAVEPNPRNTRLIEASRRANGFSHVTVSQTAAGPQTGLLVLNRSHSNGTTSDLPNDLNAMMGSDIVPCIRPDALVPPTQRIGFIKVDVEGAEYLALQGCSAIIERDHPVIVSEFSPDLMPGISGIDGPGYLAWLLRFGYRISVIEPNGNLLPALDGCETVMQVYKARGTDHIDIVATYG